jgi:hypothetical protein
MKRALIFLVNLVVLTQTLRATTYYVAKTGLDSNAGTSTNAAFLTISKAASVMNAGDTCYILSGIYRENVTPAHSGTSGSPITFTAYSGATPIVSGADMLKLYWNVYSGSIYKASTTNIVNQLFVDGNMMNIARWPNAAVNNLLNALRGSPTSRTATSITDASLPSGLQLTGAYVQIFEDEYGNAGFSAATRQITGWNSSTKTISFSSDGLWDGYQTGNYYYVYDALSLLDIPTEWYETNNTLYLWAPDNASPAAHLVETKDRTNAFTLDSLSYVTINGLDVFAAGISMANTTHCIVDNCDLIYVQHNTTADWDVDFPQANQVSGTGSEWLNSLIRYSSQDGIRLFGTNEVVSNCVIFDVDYYPGTYYACVSPYSGGTNTTVINNTLWYSGRYCVGVSSKGDTVASNDLAFGELLTSDGGATYEYASGPLDNTTIHHNWAHNSWAGIYVDSNQNDYKVYCNLCYSNYIGMLFNGFSNNVIVNNTTVSNTDEDIQFNGSGDVNVQLINNLWDVTDNSYSSGVTVTDSGWYPPIGANYVPESGSGAINGGVVDAPYTDGYVGSAPDIGAFVGGSSTYWTPGANFIPESFPLPAFPYISTYESIILADYPTSYWPMNETSGTIIHDLVGTNNGTCMNASGLTLGGPGLVAGLTAVYFTNAGSGYIDIPASSTLNTPKFTVEAWLNLPTFPVSGIGSSMFPLSLNDTSPHGWAFIVGSPNTASPYFQGWLGTSGGFAADNIEASITTSGEWAYCAMTYDGTNYVTYTNGVLAQTKAETYEAPTSDPLYLGAYNNGTPADFYQGGMQNVAIYTNALSAARILTHYEAGTNTGYAGAVVTDRPTSYWPMDETSGTIIRDLVGTNNGTAKNTDGLTLGGPGVSASEGGRAIYFTNASSGYIDIPASSTLNTPKFTVEAWVNFPTFPVSGIGSSMFPLSLNDTSPHGWAFIVGSPNTSSPYFQGWLGTSGGFAADGFDTSTITSGEWIYCAMTYDGANYVTYTNGVLAQTKAETYAAPTSDPLYLGAYNNGTPADFYQGGLERVAVYPNALSAARILAHYEAGTNAPY